MACSAAQPPFAVHCAVCDELPLIRLFKYVLYRISAYNSFIRSAFKLYKYRFRNFFARLMRYHHWITDEVTTISFKIACKQTATNTILIILNTFYSYTNYLLYVPLFFFFFFLK